MKKHALFIFVIGCLMIISPQAFSQEGLTPTQVAKIKTVGSVYLSADGETGAYTLSIPVDPFKENALPKTHVYQLNPNSGESNPLITSGSVSGITFRPEHNSVTYLTRMEGDSTTSLYELDLNENESEPQKLFSFETSISSYSWAEDGNHLVFIASEPTDEKESSLPYSPKIYEENFTNNQVYIQNIGREGHTPHQINVEGTVYAANWSPDQSKIALAVAPTPHVDDFYMKQQILIVDHHSGDVLSEVDHEGKLGMIEWSPDGSKLAIIGAANINDPIAGRLLIANPESGETKRLDEGFSGSIDQISWKDNSSLYYLASKGTESEFGTITVDGGEFESIFQKNALNLKAFVHSENGTVLFDASTPQHPDEVYLLKEGESEAKRVTNNNEWLDDVELGEQEVITYHARDGEEIEGLLIYPLNYEEGTRYPLITVVHGGPESHYDNGWITGYSDPGQMAAAQGYAVFYPNYRGSTGRGLEFTMSSQGDLAGAEFDDIVDGIDHLIEGGFVDENAVGVTGGSYGGYATAWMSTRYSDRFAAGVMFVGISNNLSKWGTSDIPEELYLVHARSRIWEDYEGYLKRSPIYYADQAKTPLLIMHGEEDTRVDPSQSYELYRHIKTRTDTPVRLVLYPGEGHGNRNSTARFDYSLRMMRWFNEYLKGDKQRPDMELDLQENAVESN